MMLTDVRGKVLRPIKARTVRLDGKGLMLYIAALVGLGGHDKVCPPWGR